MRFGFIGFCPLHWVPLCSSCFPFTHFFLLFSFMSPCLHVGLSVHVHIYMYFKPRFQVARFDNEVGSVFVPVHLVPFHRNHVHFCPVLSSFHVFIILSLLRAHVHIRLNLSFSRLPSGEACVCTPWSHRDPFGLFLEKQGARAPWRASCPTIVFVASPRGRRVCTPWSHRDPFGLFLEKQGARTPWRASWPTKTARQGGENVPAIVKLWIGCCGPLVCFTVVHVPDVVPGGV